MARTEGLRKLDHFVQYHKPVAVKLDGLTVDQYGGSKITAVWFRRRSGLTVACLGHLWDHMTPPPADSEDFLSRCDTGRYGPDCMARWDGTRYWGSQEPGRMALDLAVLEPMLTNFPDVPPGYDGWWTFHV